MKSCTIRSQAVARASLLLLIATSFVDSQSAAAHAAPATHIYWVERSVPFRGVLLRRSSVDGGDIVDLYSNDNQSVRDMTIDPVGRHLYWSIADVEGKRIQRLNLDGSNPQDLYTLPGERRFIDSVALDLVAQKLYWSETTRDTETYRIRRSNLDGSQQEDVFQTAGRPGSLNLDTMRGQMFWIDESTIPSNYALRRANLDGTDYRTLLEPSAYFNVALDPPRSRVYLVSHASDRVFTMPQNGGDLMQLYDSTHGFHNPGDVVIDSDAAFMYWVNSGSDSIARGPLYGGSREFSTLFQGLNSPEVIALGPIPEPATHLLVAFGVWLMLCSWRKRRG